MALDRLWLCLKQLRPQMFYDWPAGNDERTCVLQTFLEIRRENKATAHRI
jgi:hypothetical protein